MGKQASKMFRREIQGLEKGKGIMGSRKSQAGNRMGRKRRTSQLMFIVKCMSLIPIPSIAIWSELFEVPLTTSVGITMITGDEKGNIKE
ncbi:unnamed protein product [Penicillium roqueforti FM164]|uniref:Genomic scaffold, ProqFM164S03 n=1 Tax=Penicillium roqueforti (strain FM164) TaxID=1365484 RepID=W6QBF5_PENRF|nr:unnamed protein product [Penicillium roqueforti FM164]